MSVQLSPDTPARRDPFERLETLARLLIALVQVLLTVLQLIRLIGC